MVIFDSADIYIEGAASLQDKISRIDQVIDALLTNALKAAAKQNISEYSLNDGQTQIKTAYKGTESVMQSIMAFEKLKSYYVLKLNKTGMVRLVDGKNFVNKNNWR
jgi:signal transduction histidine kinase